MSVPDDHMNTAKTPCRRVHYGDLVDRPMPLEAPETLLERRAWQIVLTADAEDILWEVTRDRNHRIKAAFDIAARFEKEAAKRRTGGV